MKHLIINICVLVKIKSKINIKSHRRRTQIFFFFFFTFFPPNVNSAAFNCFSNCQYPGVVPEALLIEGMFNLFNAGEEYKKILSLKCELSLAIIWIYLNVLNT